MLVPRRAHGDDQRAQVAAAAGGRARRPAGDPDIRPLADMPAPRVSDGGHQDLKPLPAETASIAVWMLLERFRATGRSADPLCFAAASGFGCVGREVRAVVKSEGCGA